MYLTRVKKSGILLTAIFLLVSVPAISQKTPVLLKKINSIETTVAKDQARTGMCWSFATTSFIETELIRMGKGEFDLSEVYFARNAYHTKADNYMRYHGDATFGQGSLAHDAMNVVREKGFVNEETYPGIMYGSEKHDHTELYKVLKEFLKAVLDAEQMTPVWMDAYSAILDVYLGELPESVKYEGQELSPKNFSEKLDFDTDDYVELSSFTHHPYYSSFILEVPDNWAKALYYNLPLEEFMEVINYSLENGYSVVWDGDVSDDGFSSKKGLGIVPLTDWDDMDKDEEKETFKYLAKEKEISALERQAAFDSHNATDDHLMHLTGLYKAKNGNYYYQTKNSYGPNRNDYDGYVYMSEAYLRLNTIAIMVHKDAIPVDIAEKLYGL